MHSGISQQAALRNKLSGFSGPEVDSTSTRNWGGCTLCGLCRTRNRVALKRRGGSGRVRLLLIGEAPGEVEDVLGVPFIGPSGNVLKHLFSYTTHPFSYLITNTVSCRPQTVVYLSTEAENCELPNQTKVNKHDTDSSSSATNFDLLTKATSNQSVLSAFEELIPYEDYEIDDYNREPTSKEIEACKPHIEELQRDYSPHGIVYLGNVARSYRPISPSEHKEPNSQFQVPTLSLLHPAYIVRLEYKVQTLRKEAHKLSGFIRSLHIHI